MVSKLHHYVPRFYLEGFADPGKPSNIWVYQEDASEPRSQGIKGTAAEGYYYSLEGIDGSKNDIIEREVLSKIETHAAPILSRLRSERIPKLWEDDQIQLTPFIATLWTRSPRMRADFAELLDIGVRCAAKVAVEDDNDAARFLKSHPDLNLSLAELRELAEALQDPEKFEISIHKNLLTGLPFLLSRDLDPYILGRKWCLLQAPREVDFVTSDSPLSVFSLGSGGEALIGAGIGLRDAELTLPICPTLALRLSITERKQRRRTCPAEVREINRRVTYQAHRYIYSHRRSRRISAIARESASYRAAPKVDAKVAAANFHRRWKEQAHRG